MNKKPLSYVDMLKMLENYEVLKEFENMVDDDSEQQKQIEIDEIRSQSDHAEFNETYDAYLPKNGLDYNNITKHHNVEYSNEMLWHDNRYERSRQLSLNIPSEIAEFNKANIGNNVSVSYKRTSPESFKPTKSHEHDAGYDLRATSLKYDNNMLEYGTGIHINIPVGYVGILTPRSSVSERNMLLANSVGIIDAGYQGEIKVRYKLLKDAKIYDIGDRVAQIVIIELPQVELIEVDDFTRSARGNGGFGSTGL